MTSSDLQLALRVTRLALESTSSLENALNAAFQTGLFAPELRDQVKAILEQEQTVILSDPHVLSNRQLSDRTWLNEMDRSNWYYWPTLRSFLKDRKGWAVPSIRSLDNATDRILEQLEHPGRERFDTRGLVIGFVQSGKTANYTALIAKAADAGYRLIIVLAGVHNLLRRQTQSRLIKELVGYSRPPEGSPVIPPSVPLPPTGKQWITLTSEKLLGDFDPGSLNYGTLQGEVPILMVVKKNGTILRRLHQWFNTAPPDLLGRLPTLIIDDEADQASINTGGNRPPQNADDPDDEDRYSQEVPSDAEPPSIINDLIRTLLRTFRRAAYVAYTATPFANILVPHYAEDASAGPDLYPKDFIVDLPRPVGYFGAEEIFGRLDSDSAQRTGGLDIIREIPVEQLDAIRPRRARDTGIFQPTIPDSLEKAILDFILAGSARRQRGAGDVPATMLIHTSERVAVQQRLAKVVQDRFEDLRDEWRYMRQDGILQRLERRWNTEFRPLTRSLHNELDIPFSMLAEHITPFLEALEIRQINSDTEDELDYEREKTLKVVVVGGNRLSRGLTLEGLLVSYFVRQSATYDTLMQMGRWFGFRPNYEDLTRIYMTRSLRGWFQDLAAVEHQLRADLAIYENGQVTPMELGPRIQAHPAMLVTTRLKMKHASELVIAQSYAGQLLQTTKFHFDDSAWLDQNLKVTRQFIGSLGSPTEANDNQPVWGGVSWEAVVWFLERYQVSPLELTFPPALVQSFIKRQTAQNELVEWVVALKGRKTFAPVLQTIDLGVAGGNPANLISRTRLKNRPESLGVITSPSDEMTGLTQEQLDRIEEIVDGKRVTRGRAYRGVRPKTQGLLLLYPISRYSGHEGTLGDPGEEETGEGDLRGRTPIYENPEQGRDMIGVALSFPLSETAKAIKGRYIVGTANEGWRAE